MKNLKNNFLLSKSFMSRRKSVRLEKLFLVSQIGTALRGKIEKITLFSLAGEGSVAKRIQISWNFVNYLLKLRKHHGDQFVVKWLKANHVALQKYVANDRLHSLRELEPNLPLPRLINGCPAIITARDRKLIREGKAGIIRYWMSLFGLFRIMSCLGKPKIGTIMEPFKGSVDELTALVRFLEISSPQIFFRRLGIPLRFKLAPTSFKISQKSSPSNTLAYAGLLTDVSLLMKGFVKTQHLKEIIEISSLEGPLIWKNLCSYIDLFTYDESFRWKRLIEKALSIVNQVYDKGLSLPTKKSWRKDPGASTGLSSFAIKEEAAGKVRVFALVDSVTQSVLAPLHTALFDILKKIPNDGTFDQDASVKRSTKKAMEAGLAFSFDLSAATDRLPVQLTAAIIENIVGIQGIGDAWRKVLCDRTFNFSEAVNRKYPVFCDSSTFIDSAGLSGYRYSVGQPMGALSSWAGLAITHHWILQYCSASTGNKFHWDERYEVLGDDIVIFDRDLATKYLEVMNALGVEINPTKSVSSSLPIFEFAKRFVVNGVNVSSLSFQQLISSTSLGARVADCFHYAKSGVLQNLDILSNILCKKFVKGGVSKFYNELAVPALGLLGLLHQKGVIEHRLVIGSLVNPVKDFDWEKAKFDFPLRTVLKLVLECLNGKWKGSYPFSKEDVRNRVYSNLLPLLVGVILNEAYVKASKLQDDYKKLLHKGADIMVPDPISVPEDPAMLVILRNQILALLDWETHKGKTLEEHDKASAPRQSPRGNLGFGKSKIQPLFRSRGALSAGINSGMFLGHTITIKQIPEEMKLADEVNTLIQQFLSETAAPVSFESACLMLDRVDMAILKWTFRTDVSPLKFETDKSRTIEIVRKAVGSILAIESLGADLDPASPFEES